MGSVISPTSSRKRVPPLAASKSPGRSDAAPVKAPRAWPKSSLSKRVSVMAPQLTAMKGPSFREDWSWTKRATRSFPAPLSPVINTVESVPAMDLARSINLRISGLRVMISVGSSSIFEMTDSLRVFSRNSLSVRLSVVVTSLRASSIPTRLKTARSPPTSSPHSSSDLIIT